MVCELGASDQYREPTPINQPRQRYVLACDDCGHFPCSCKVPAETFEPPIELSNKRISGILEKMPLSERLQTEVLQVKMQVVAEGGDPNVLTKSGYWDGTSNRPKPPTPEERPDYVPPPAEELPPVEKAIQDEILRQPEEMWTPPGTPELGIFDPNEPALMICGMGIDAPLHVDLEGAEYVGQTLPKCHAFDPRTGTKYAHPPINHYHNDFAQLLGPVTSGGTLRPFVPEAHVGLADKEAAKAEAERQWTAEHGGKSALEVAAEPPTPKPNVLDGSLVEEAKDWLKNHPVEKLGGKVSAAFEQERKAYDLSPYGYKLLGKPTITGGESITVNGAEVGTTGKPIDRRGVDHPAHYNQHPSGVECINIIECMPFNIAATIKYLWRANLKHDTPLKDLEKARWHLDREIQRLEKSKT